MPFSVGDKVTIAHDAAYRFGGAVGTCARRGVAGTVSAVYQVRGLGLRHRVSFPPANGSPVWTELRADEMIAA